MVAAVPGEPDRQRADLGQAVDRSGSHGAISQELVKFDTQAMENPEISGVEYQQGTLLGYEIREYLLEKWNHKCAYFGKENVPLQVEHIHPKCNGGSGRVSNLTLACDPCNKRKGNRPVAEFLKNKPDLLARIRRKPRRRSRMLLRLMPRGGSYSAAWRRSVFRSNAGAAVGPSSTGLRRAIRRPTGLTRRASGSRVNRSA